MCTYIHVCMYIQMYPPTHTRVYTQTFLHTHVDTHVHSGTVLKGEPSIFMSLGKGSSCVFPVGSVLRNPAPYVPSSHSQASLLSKLESPMAKA